MKARLIFAGVVALGAALLTWLVLGESSPLREYFPWRVGIPNPWAGLNIIPFVVAAVISRSHGGGDAWVFMSGLLIQWFLIAFFLPSFIRTARQVFK